MSKKKSESKSQPEVIPAPYELIGFNMSKKKSESKSQHYSDTFKKLLNWF